MVYCYWSKYSIMWSNINNIPLPEGAPGFRHVLYNEFIQEKLLLLTICSLFILDVNAYCEISFGVPSIVNVVTCILIFVTVVSKIFCCIPNYELLRIPNFTWIRALITSKSWFGNKWWNSTSYFLTCSTIFTSSVEVLYVIF